jgi:regulator of protease activity HflC (stomatin/prohibitin superfamily)
VQNEEEETIKRAAFRFVDERSFMQSLVRCIEGSIRAFVATKKQADVLGLRHEICDAVNSHIEHELNDWGFHLINLQINDIAFDEAIMRSMAQVVAQARRLVAEAERDADRLRGEGNALQRKQIAAGLVEAEEMLHAKHVDSSLLLYTEWLESMKLVASGSSGNILSFDGSMEGFEKTMKQMTMLGRARTPSGVETH